MKHLALLMGLIPLALCAVITTRFGQTAINIFNYGLGQFTAGLPATAANCPDNVGGCAVGAIQSTLGVALMAVAGGGAYAGAFKTG